MCRSALSVLVRPRLPLTALDPLGEALKRPLRGKLSLSRTDPEPIKAKRRDLYSILARFLAFYLSVLYSQHKNGTGLEPWKRARDVWGSIASSPESSPQFETPASSKARWPASKSNPGSSLRGRTTVSGLYYYYYVLLLPPALPPFFSPVLFSTAFYRD